MEDPIPQKANEYTELNNLEELASLATKIFFRSKHAKHTYSTLKDNKSCEHCITCIEALETLVEKKQCFRCKEFHYNTNDGLSFKEASKHFFTQRQCKTPSLFSAFNLLYKKFPKEQYPQAVKPIKAFLKTLREDSSESEDEDERTDPPLKKHKKDSPEHKKHTIEDILNNQHSCDYCSQCIDAQQQLYNGICPVCGKKEYYGDTGKPHRQNAVRHIPNCMEMTMEQKQIFAPLILHIRTEYADGVKIKKFFSYFNKNNNIVKN